MYIDPHSAIVSLPDVMDQLRNALKTQTGWVWTLLGGGPDLQFRWTSVNCFVSLF